MTELYKLSTARGEFLTSLREIEEVLMKVAPPKKNDPDIKNYIHGAAILFLSAKLENYISDLFEGMAQEFCRLGVSENQIPNALLGWVFLRDGNEQSTKKYIANGNEGEYIKNVGDYLNGEVFSSTSSYLTADKFRGLADKSYPSVRNLKKMYKRIGVASIFGLLKTRMKSNADAELESLNSTRGALAHSGISGTLTYSDVKSKIESIKKLVAALDKETYYYLRSEGCAAYWKHV